MRDVIEAAISKVIAEDTAYPADASDRARAAIDVLRKGIADKHIWNAAFEDAKAALARDYDKTQGLLWRKFSQAQYNLIYFLEPGQATLRNVNTWAGQIEQLLNDKAKALKWMHRFSGPAVDTNVAELERAWPAKDEVLKYLEGVRTWAMVQPLIDQAKPFVVKGRKPSERPSNIYSPPPASMEIKQLVAAKLREITDPLVPEAVENLHKYFVDRLSPGLVKSSPLQR